MLNNTILHLKFLTVFLVNLRTPHLNDFYEGASSLEGFIKILK